MMKNTHLFHQLLSGYLDSLLKWKNQNPKLTQSL